MHEARFQNEPALINTVNISPMKNECNVIPIRRKRASNRMDQIHRSTRIKGLVFISYIHVWRNIQRD